MKKYKVEFIINLEDDEFYDERFIESCIDHNLEVIDGVDNINNIKITYFLSKESEE